jgi:hypothetical protein
VLDLAHDAVEVVVLQNGPAQTLSLICGYSRHGLVRRPAR